jgi:hypothetical protein
LRQESPGLAPCLRNRVWLKKQTGFDNLSLMNKAIKIVSLNKSGELDFEYWLKKSSAERLDTLQYLREMVYNLKHESRKGLQRFLKVTQRKKS